MTRARELWEQRQRQKQGDSPADITSRAPSFVKTGSRARELWSQRQQEMAGTASRFQGVLDRYNKLVSTAGGMADYYKTYRTEDERNSYRSNYYQDLESLQQDIRSQMNGLDGMPGDMGSNLLSGLDSLFDSLAYYENRNILNYDLESAQKEIDELDSRIGELRGMSRLEAMNTGQMQQWGKTREQVAALEKERSEKLAYLNQARHLQARVELASAPENADFDSLSGYRQGGDELYEYINGRDNGQRAAIDYAHRYLDNITFSDNPYAAPIENPYQAAGYDLMTDDEIGIYNYYYAKEGKDKANQYLKSMEETLRQRKATGAFQQLEGSTGLELLFGISAGLDQWESGAKALGDNKSDYISPSAIQLASQMVREDLADIGPKMPDWLGGGSLGQGAYDLVTTTANMAPSILSSMVTNALVPGSGPIIGNAMMFASAAGNAYTEALNAGYDKRQARLYSTLVGGSEIGLQALLGGISSLGGVSSQAMSKMLDGVDNAFFRVAGKLGINALSEGIEEGTQEILTPFFENLALHKDEQVDLSEVAYSALLGAVTGFLLESRTAISEDLSVSRTGNQVMDAGIDVRRLQELGKTMSADSVAYQLAGKIDESTGAYTIGRMFNELGASLTEANLADIQRDLQAKGMDSKNANLHAQVMNIIVEGGELSDFQMRLIEQNDVLAKTLQDVIIDKNSTVYQRTQGYNEMLMALAKKKAGGQPQTADTGSQDIREAAEQAAAQETAQGAPAAPGTGNARIVATQEPVTVTGISSVENGNVRLRTQDGQEMAISDVDLGDSAPVYEAAAAVAADPQTANLLVKGFNLNSFVSGAEYGMALRHAYQLGKIGLSETQVASSPLTNVLPAAVRKAAYEQGRQAGDKQLQKASVKAMAKKRPEVQLNEQGGYLMYPDKLYAKATDDQRANIDAMTYVADMLQVPIYIYKSEVQDGRHVGANGWYDPSDGSIHIDIHAGMNGEGAMLFTLAHELTHMMRDWDPEKFRKLADFLNAEYGRKGISVEELIERKMPQVRRTYAQKGYSDEQLYDIAYEEMVADSMEPMLTDGRVIQKLKTRDQTGWSFIKDYILEIAEKVRKAYAKLKPNSVEGQQVAAMKDRIEAIEDLFLEGIESAGARAAAAQKNTAQTGGVAASSRYQMKQSEIDAIQAISKKDSSGKDVGKSINEFSSAEIKATERFARQYWQEMDTKSPFFRAWFGDWRSKDTTPIRIATQQGNARKLKTNADTGWKINIGARVFDEAKQNSRRSRNARPYLAYLEDIIDKAILLDSLTIPKSKAKSINSLLMHSFYAVADIGQGPQLLKLYVEEMNNPNEENPTKRAYKLKNIEIQQLGAKGSSNSSSPVTQTAGIKSVADLFAAVKAKDPEFDPNPANDSLLNQDGTPKAVYHGTNSDFWEFSSKDGTYWFSENEDYAEAMAHERKGNRIIRSYVKLENPLEVTLREGEFSDPNYEKPYIRKAKQLGHDGVIFDVDTDNELVKETFYVTFSPEQIKSATDNIGTFDRSNPDIRYQERNNQFSELDKAIQAERKDLPETVKDLHKIFEIERMNSKGVIFTPKSIEAVSRELLRKYPVKQKWAEFTNLMVEICTELSATSDLTVPKTESIIGKAVDWLMDNWKTELDSFAQDVLANIRGKRIYLDDEQRQEVQYKFGSYNGYRRAVMGNVILTSKDAISLDSQWHEWAQDYPSIFDPDTASNDMPQALLGTIGKLRDMTTDRTMGIDIAGREQALFRDVLDSVIRAAVYPKNPDPKLSPQELVVQGLKEQHSAEIAALVKKHERRMERFRKEHDAQVNALRDKAEENRKWAKTMRETTVLRHRIQRTVNQLNSMLLKETKNRHIPEVLKLAVVEALEAVNMDTVNAQARIQELQKQIEQTSDQDKVEELQERIATLQEMGGRVDKKLERLEKAYSEIKADADPALDYAFDEEVLNQIQRVKNLVGRRALREMTKAELEAVEELYTVILTRVRTMNETFASEKKESISRLGKQAITEVELAGGRTDKRLAVTQPLRAFSWNNEKPIYAFRRIGSDTLTGLYNNVRRGEDVWAQDISEARAFVREQAKAHNQKNWDMDKRYSFTGTNGREFSLDIGQILTLYAYSKRKQAWDHLEKGGFQYGPYTKVTEKTEAGVKITYELTSAQTYKVNRPLLEEIVSVLTPEQRAFADAMQKYLSDTMGNKGNEVSMKLYGIKLFKEKYYFPLKSSPAFLDQEAQKAKGEVKIKSKGFTKQTQDKASNPVYLRSFMDVWADHVNEMSMYHGFTLPLEDFYRVRNYREGMVGAEEGQDAADSRSVTETIQNAYGKEAVQYIEQLLKDLNGGAMGDPRETIAKGLMSRHKKAAVMASLSVLVQQPTSIYRAMSEIDHKYFTAAPIARGLFRTANVKKHQQLWSELKQYAPVAIIKEMGYFDTNMGMSTRDYLQSPEYEGIKEKAKAFWTDEGFRDDFFGKFPALADELGWVSIWEAVKKEQAEKNKALMNSDKEAFLRLCGERFTDVIAKTQVYDSVLSRSANMRSKGVYMSMATAFMAEPTTTANMIEDAVRRGLKGDKKYARRVFGAVLGSHLMNSLLVSFVYAMRDDDEDETFTEKYLARLTTELVEGINPITYIPFARDVWSIMQGFDVERADMSLISDLAAAAKKRITLASKDTDSMTEEQMQERLGKVDQANWALAEILSSLVGFPLKNIRRDAMGVKNLLKTLTLDMNGRQTSSGSLLDKIGNDLWASIPGAERLLGESKSKQLYDAIVSEDAAYVSRLKAGYKSTNSYSQAVRKALREYDGRIRQAAQARNSGDIDTYYRLATEIKKEKRFTHNDVIAAINAEINALNKGENSGSSDTEVIKKMFTADDFQMSLLQGDAKLAKTIRDSIIETEILNGKSKTEAENAFQSAATSSIKEAFLAGSLSERSVETALISYGGLDEASAEAKSAEWNFEKEHGFTFSDRKNAYLAGKVSREEMVKTLMATGKTEDQAEDQVMVYDWLKEVPDSEGITASAIENYNAFCAGVGITKQQYFAAWEMMGDMESDFNESGNSIRNSRTQKVMAYINSLPLYPQQKTALALTQYKSSTVQKYRLW